jgi:diguanylate cyclase (GGDEF)-like protein
MVVRHFADVAVSETREMDLLARYSSTAIALLLPKTQFGEAAQVAQRLHEEVARRFADSPAERRPTLSVGITCVAEGDDVVRLLHRTEAALDSAKSRGGNTTHFHNGQWTEEISELTVAAG